MVGPKLPREFVFHSSRKNDFRTRKAEHHNDDIRFRGGSGDKVLIFSKYWRLYSIAAGKPLVDEGPENSEPNSFYSPDFKYYLRAESTEPGDDPDHFALYRAADGKLIISLAKFAWVYDPVWSSQSNRFAIVGVPMTGASPLPLHHVEELGAP